MILVNNLILDINIGAGSDEHSEAVDAACSDTAESIVEILKEMRESF